MILGFPLRFRITYLIIILDFLKGKKFVNTSWHNNRSFHIAKRGIFPRSRNIYISHHCSSYSHILIFLIFLLAMWLSHTRGDLWKCVIPDISRMFISRTNYHHIHLFRILCHVVHLEENVGEFNHITGQESKTRNSRQLNRTSHRFRQSRPFFCHFHFSCQQFIFMPRVQI